MKTKLIEVTARDIENGWAGDCKKCPVSLAIRRTFKKGKDFVSVLEDHYSKYVLPSRRSLIRIGTKEVKAPESVVKFVEAFDKDGILKPFTFELEY